MNKFAAQSMRRFATLLLTLSMENNAQLSMSSNVIPSMNKFANLPSLAMVVVVDLEAVEVVVEVEQEADMVLQLLLLADKFQDKNAGVFLESSVTMFQDNNARMCRPSSALLSPDSSARPSPGGSALRWQE